MSREFVVRPQAESELDEAAAWYAERSRGLGAEFVRVVDAAFAAIKRNPLQFPAVHGQVRRAVIRRFPYGVLFTESEDQIVGSRSSILGAIPSVGRVEAEGL